MQALTRRELIRGVAPTAAALAAAPRAVARSLAAGESPVRARMVLGCQRSPTDERALDFFKRHAVEHICGYPPDEDAPGAYGTESLARLKERCERHGVALEMVQFPFMASNAITATARKGIMLGREPERQREIDEVCEIIRSCAAVGIPAVKYNLNLLGVLRTGREAGRGGTSGSRWALADARDPEALTLAGRVDEQQAWERIRYFLERVVPVAEQHRIRLACHPHDPGVPPAGFQGIVRVLGTVEGLRRFVGVAESPYHGLNFCVGSVAEMLQDPPREIADVVREFGARGKLFNIHFRNIRGRRDAFTETFPDEGDLDMLQVMRTLQQVGYSYMVMPDHMPTHPDDPGGHQAFAFAYGYIKGLIQATGALG